MSLDPIQPLCEALLACAKTALETDGTGPVGRYFVNEGGAVGDQLAWDDCCDGQCWVAWEETRNQPGFDLLPSDPHCASSWVVALRVGVLRCAAEVHEETGYPTVAAMLASARRRATDAWAVLEAVRCCLLDFADGTWDELVDYRIDGQDPLGAEGQCVGSEIRLRVLLTTDD